MPKNLDEVALAALKLQARINRLDVELEAQKVILREIANGEVLSHTITGHGTITVTKPREGGVATTTLVLDTEKLEAHQDVKKSLIKKGFVIESSTTSKGAKASVTVKPNV